MTALLASNTVHWGGFVWKGNFTTVDLIAASTNSLNGALLARRPDHYKQFTIVGILLMALLGGLGGGITRDVLVAQVPAALTNPAYKLPRELRDLGLTVENADPTTTTETVGGTA